MSLFSRCSSFVARRLLLVVVAGAMVHPDQIGNRAVAATGPAKPALTAGTSRQGITFRDRLIAGLQARRGSEVEFVDAVVLQVRLGKLPERLVNQTFFWSRDRAARPGRTTATAGTRRPIIYFQPVMTAQAKRLGVTL